MAARSNGKPKALPRLVPGTPGKPRQRREVNLPGIGASVVLEAPSFAAWQEVNALDISEGARDVALAALAMVEPAMTVEQLTAAVKDWPFSDWVILDRELEDLMGISEEALRAAQDEFRASGE